MEARRTSADRGRLEGQLTSNPRATPHRPTAGPTDLNDYASWLLTCVPESERRPAEALRYAKRAVESQANPLYLDTLALVYFQTGAIDEAVKTEERALAALPPSPSAAKPACCWREVGAFGLPEGCAVPGFTSLPAQ